MQTATKSPTRSEGRSPNETNPLKVPRPKPTATADRQPGSLWVRAVAVRGADARRVRARQDVRVILYAQTPWRRTFQIAGDLLVAAWIVLWVRAGLWVHEVVGRLAAPGRTLEDAGTSLSESLTSAGDTVARVPLVGDDARAPFTAAGGAADSIAQAGVEVQEGATQLALLLGLTIAAVPILLVAAVWLLARARFVSRARAATRILDSAGDLDLFALRALATQPVRALARVSSDPVNDWRDGDPEVVRALASLELGALGLRVPAWSTSA